MKKKTFFRTMLLCAAMVMCAQGAKADNFTAGQKTYLQVSGEWASDGAKFAAYFFDGSTNEWSDFGTSIGGNYYEITIPAGYSGEGWPNVKFVRFNPADSSPSWTNWGETGNLSANGNTSNRVFVVSGWGGGDWQDMSLTWDATYTPFVKIGYNGLAGINGSPSLDKPLDWFTIAHNAGSIWWLNLGGGAKPSFIPTGLTVSMKYDLYSNIDHSLVGTTQVIPSSNNVNGAFIFDAVGVSFLELTEGEPYYIKFWYEMEYNGIVVRYDNDGNNYTIDFSVAYSHNVTYAAQHIWRLVSAPFVGWTAGDFGFNNEPRVAIRTMNPTTTNTFTWTTQTNENYSFSQGQAFAYQVSPKDLGENNNAANWNNGILTFENHTLAGDFFFGIPAAEDAKYSLLGNPYTVPINIEDLAGPDGAIIKVGYYSLNDDGLTFAAHDTGTIDAWTGFLAVNSGGGSLAFAKPSNAPAPAPALAATPRERMTVTAANENGSHYTILKRNQYGSSTAIGNFDLDFINGGLLEYPQIFTLKNDVQLGINAINENEENVTVPLGIVADYNGPITLSLAGMDSYNCTVTLTDNLASQPIDLTGLSTYDYPTTIDGNVSTRFALQFGQRVPTALQTTETANVQAFVRDGKITVVSSDALQNVTVYSVSGAQVFNAATAGTATYTVNEKLPAGAYLVTVRTAKETKTQKVAVCN